MEQVQAADGRSRAGQRFRTWASALSPTGRTAGPVQRAEHAGLTFAFRARAFAILVVSAWLTVGVESPRNVYYLAYAVALFLLGYIPYHFRGHRHAETIKFVFVLLDAALIAAAIIVPPPADFGVAWPIQIRLRGQQFLFLLLLLGEAALTYSPRRVLWTGASIALVWSAGVGVIVGLPDTISRIVDPAEGPPTHALMLQTYLDPSFVSLSSWQIQIVATFVLTVLTALAVLRGRMHLLAEARAEVGRSDLARYVSPDVAEALSVQGEAGFGEPETRHVAILFADIIGFTGLTERLSPDRTFALLRSFQERSSRVAMRHRGTLDKYLGDGLMATFGALTDEEDASARAVACAFALRDEFRRWSDKRVERGLDPIQVAIGVHCGPVMVGNLGSDRHMEFTVVGDAVNVASRLEKAAREYGCLIVASEDCTRAAGHEWQAMFDRSVELHLRGRTMPLTVCLADVVDRERSTAAIPLS